MILLKENRIVRGDLYELIKRWAVWFKTPWGYCETLDEAVKVMEEAEFDANVTIIPVTVAISETTHEIMER